MLFPLPKRLRNQDDSMPRGITQQNLIIIIACVAGGLFLLCIVCALLAGIMLPALGAARRTANQMKNSSQTRGVHQSMVIFAQNNNNYLPGLDAKGQLLFPNSPEMTAATGNTLSGGSMSARYYILLNGSFIAGDMLINPQDVLPKWSNSTALPTVDQFSYSLLRIANSPTTTSFGNQLVETKTGSTPTQYGRPVEWRDNANSQAILIADRNTGMAPTSDQVRSVWSTSSGINADWKGTVLWGDNHAEFLNATNARLGTLSLNTKYGSTLNSDDFLFNEKGTAGKDPKASTMFGYTSDNH
jgi:hypothetical protein